HYTVRKDQLTQILLSSVQQMSPDEKAQLTSLLLREGISGILGRLGITS
ncbi:YfeC-like transcriptional regulator, partial [Rosenbergiella collisarenosi]